MGVKYSQYNTLLKVNDKFGLFYNAMSDKFIILKSKAYDTLANSDVALLQQRDAVLYSQLLEVGGIVDVDVDEVQQVRDLIHQVDDDDTIFYLHVNPTVDCNFRCWYCYENHVKGSKMSNDTCEAVKKLIDNIISQQSHLKIFHLAFFGGEPLMYFNVVARPLIEHLYLACVKKNILPQIHFTSNGYLLTQNMLEFFKNKNISFQITLDGNRELHNKTRFVKNGKGSFDAIIRNIKKLVRQGHHVIMRINYTADNIFSTSDICQEFEDLEIPYRANIAVDFQRVWQDDGTSVCEDDVDSAMFDSAKMFQEKGFKAECSITHNSVKNSCYGSKRNSVLVNYNGDLYQCTARDFSKDNRYGILFSDGKLKYAEGLIERRRTSRFSKSVCTSCRIAPICGGGCAQKAMEQGHTDACSLGRTQQDIDKYVIDRFECEIVSHSNNY